MIAPHDKLIGTLFESTIVKQNSLYVNVSVIFTKLDRSTFLATFETPVCLTIKASSETSSKTMQGHELQGRFFSQLGSGELLEFLLMSSHDVDANLSIVYDVLSITFRLSTFSNCFKRQVGHFNCSTVEIENF